MTIPLTNDVIALYTILIFIWYCIIYEERIGGQSSTHTSKLVELCKYGVFFASYIPHKWFLIFDHLLAHVGFATHLLNFALNYPSKTKQKNSSVSDVCALS